MSIGDVDFGHQDFPSLPRARPKPSLVLSIYAPTRSILLNFGKPRPTIREVEKARKAKAIAVAAAPQKQRPAPATPAVKNCEEQGEAEEVGWFPKWLMPFECCKSVFTRPHA